MRSLQSKLASGLLLSLIVSFSALWLLVSINVQFLAKDYIASRLQHDSETLLNRIGFDPQGKLMLDATRIDLIYKQPFSGHYFEITAGSQSLTSRSLWDQSLKHSIINTGQQIRYLQSGPEQQSLLVLSSGYKKQGHQLTITIAEDLNPINKNISEFKYSFAALAGSMLIILLILQRFILRRSLTPLAKIQTELKQLQQGKLDKLGTDFPAELQPLINEVNHLLELMQQRLRRSRDASSDLAHAIKKPLTVIRQITDKNDLPAETKTVLMKQADGIYQITDRILKRARLAGHIHHSGALFSFADDLPALIKTLNMMHADKTLHLDIKVADNIVCPLDQEDMLELLGNLLDNAYKWASNKIVLNISSNAELNIQIEDDGPGADPEKINELSKRGVRLDEKTQGHGFGLAITADIVNDYHGQMYFTDSTELGGFKVDIKLPLEINYP